MPRQEYWICVADGDNPDAVRIGKGATADDAFRDAFDLRYNGARHFCLALGTNRREVTTDKRRVAHVKEAVEKWRALVGDREVPVTAAGRPRKLRRHVVTLACDTNATPEQRRRALEAARRAYKTALLDQGCAFTDAESDEWSDD